MRRLAAVLSLVTMPTVLAQSPPAYRVTHTYVLGGDGGWDYVVPDPPQHRVFIGRQNRVMVVDENDGKLLGEVTGIDGAHGVAIVERAGHGFATSGNDGSVVMFDLTTFKTLGRVPAAEDADAIIYDPPSNRVFTFNGDAHSSTVVDPVGKLWMSLMARLMSWPVCQRSKYENDCCRRWAQTRLRRSNSTASESLPVVMRRSSETPKRTTATASSRSP